MTTEIKESIEIDRPPNVVWPVMVGVERWHEWTPTVTSVERLDASRFGMGSRLRIHQPRLRTMEWRVSEFIEGRRFTWEARSPGLFVVAIHAVQPSGEGSIVTLTLRQTGWLSSLVTLLFGSLSRKYVTTEAQSLKRRCEGTT